MELLELFYGRSFCCQKNDIPFTAIGRDHCGEQENKVLKGRGGVPGQSSNSNRTNRYFMTSPILSQMYSEMLKAGGASDPNSKSHHQLGNAYTQRQNRWVTVYLFCAHSKDGRCLYRQTKRMPHFVISWPGRCFPMSYTRVWLYILMHSSLVSRTTVSRVETGLFT